MRAARPRTHPAWHGLVGRDKKDMPVAKDESMRSDVESVVSDSLIQGKADLDSQLAESATVIDGYIPAAATSTSEEPEDVVETDGDLDGTDASVDPDEVDDPADDTDLAGEELSRELADPEPFDVVDDEAEELDEAEFDADEADDLPDTSDEPIDDPAQLAEAEAVAVAARSTRPTKKRASADVTAPDKPTTRPAKKPSAPVRKATSTPARDAGKSERRTRTTPAQFVRESIAELRKVVWPTGNQVRQHFVAVLVFVLFIIAFVGLLDFGLGWALLKLLG